MKLAYPFLAGVFTGLRSATAVATLARAAQDGSITLSPPLRFVASRWCARSASLGEIGEFFADKLPFTPNRTDRRSIVVRLAAGAFAGALVASSQKESIVIGALIGIAGALVGTYGGFYLRTGLVRALRVPDFPVALLEDVVTTGGSIWLTSQLASPAREEGATLVAAQA